MLVSQELLLVAVLPRHTKVVLGSFLGISTIIYLLP
jgi:hypothetical protein